MPPQSPDSPNLLKNQIIDAARVAFSAEGPEADIVTILELARVSRTTLYRHFPRKVDLLCAVTMQMVCVSGDAAYELLQIRDGREMMRQAYDLSFRQFEEYGVLASLALAGRLPAECQQYVPLDDAHRVIGRIIKTCKAQGHCKEGVETRFAVDVIFALTGPEFFSRRRQAGASYEKIKNDVLSLIFEAFGRDS